MRLGFLIFAQLQYPPYMFNLILFGPPGSGKGTQSANILSKYNLQHISTGDLLRSEKANKTPLGIEATKYMDQGMLVPDQVVIGMIDSKLKENPNARGFIFDGFPRTKQQAIALDALLATAGTPISLVIALEVPDQELTTRILERAKTSGRVDDTEEVIKKRVEVYRAETEIVATHYQAMGKVAHIQGTGTVPEIFENISAQINKFILPQ